MDDEGIEGIAYAASSALGIRDDSLTHLYVSLLVEVAVYHTCSRLNDRHLGGVSHKLDELFASTRDAEVSFLHCLLIDFLYV